MLMYHTHQFASTYFFTYHARSYIQNPKSLISFNIFSFSTITEGALSASKVILQDPYSQVGYLHLSTERSYSAGNKTQNKHITWYYLCGFILYENSYIHIYYILLFINRSLYFWYLHVSSMFSFRSVFDLPFSHFCFHVLLFQHSHFRTTQSLAQQIISLFL